MTIRVNTTDFVYQPSDDDPFNNLAPPQEGPRSFAADKAVIWETSVALNDFLKAVSYAKTDFSHELRRGNQETLEETAKRYQSFAERSEVTLAIYEQIKALAQLEIDLYNAQLTINTQIAAFNNQLSSTYSTARTALNNAIATYNGITPATAESQAALQNAIAAYNTVASQIYLDYFSQRESYQQLIDQMLVINLMRSELGMPSLNPGSAGIPFVPYGGDLVNLGITPATAPPNVPSLAQPSSLSTVSLIPTPLSMNQAITLYFPGALEKNTFLLQIAKLLNLNLENMITQFLASLNPGDATLPNAYIQRRPDLLINTASSVSPGAGVSSILVAMGPGTGLDQVITKAIYQAYYLQANQPPPQKLLNDIAIFAADLVSQIALEAGQSPVLQPPNESQPPTSPEAHQLDRANAFGQAIHKAVSSDLVNQNIKRLILSNPELNHLTLGQKEELTDLLSAVFKTGLSELALSQIALSLNSPGLIGQVLANIQGAPPSSALFHSSPEKKLSTLLQDPLGLGQMRHQLALSLIAEGLTPTEAEALASKALNHALNAGPFVSTTALVDAISAQLANSGLEAPQIKQVANLIGNFINSEMAQPFLDQRFTSHMVQQLLNEAGAPLPLPTTSTSSVLTPTSTTPTTVVTPASTTSTSVPPTPVIPQLSPGTINRVMYDRILQVDLKRPEVLEAVKEVLTDTDPLTIREFRDQLVQRLIDKNLSPDDAFAIANHFVVLHTPLPQDNPLLEIPPKEVLKPPALIESLSIFIVDRFTPEDDVFQARLRAEQTARTTIQILQDLNTQVGVIRDQGERFVDDLFQRVPYVSIPTVPLFAIKDNVDSLVQMQITHYLTPADQDNVRTQNLNAQPSNFKRNIDFEV